MSLSAVEAGRRVRVVSVAGGHGVVSRLAALGVLPGVEVEVLINSMHGPSLVAVMGTRIALGRGMAHKVLVA